MRWRTASYFLSIVGCLLSGCSDVTAPIGGRYVLISIAGAPLPAEYGANTDYHGRVLADTLLLNAGAGEERIVVQTSLGAAPYTQTTRLVYDVRGNRVEITLIPGCPPNADCVLGHLIGRVTANGIEIDDSNLYRTPLTFAPSQE